MELDFQQGLTIPVTLSSEWVFIEVAQGKVELHIESSGERVYLTQKSLFRYKNGLLGRVLITASGVVELEHGIGEFTPPIEGQSLEVSSIPAVEIAAGQQVAVESLPKVQIEAGQELAVNSLPQVEIASGQQVSVNSMPQLEIAAGQQVAVDSLPKVQIEAGQVLAVNSLPQVEIALGQEVSINSLPQVELATGQSVVVDSLPKVVLEVSSNIAAHVGEMPFSVPSNPNRKGIIIKAKSSNTGVIDLQGFELAAGESLTIETTAQIDLTGAAPDAAQVLEY